MLLPLFLKVLSIYFHCCFLYCFKNVYACCLLFWRWWSWGWKWMNQSITLWEHVIAIVVVATTTTTIIIINSIYHKQHHNYGQHYTIHIRCYSYVCILVYFVWNLKPAWLLLILFIEITSTEYNFFCLFFVFILCSIVIWWLFKLHFHIKFSLYKTFFFLIFCLHLFNFNVQMHLLCKQ